MQSIDFAATVDFVERSLHSDLRLERIAEHTGYSPYHLHRSFRAAFGLTPHAYVHRRRLTEAARELSLTSEPVIDIATSHGFGNQQSFTNAFTAGYGLSPAVWRSTRPFFPLLSPYHFAESEWGIGRAADGFEITERADVGRLLPLSYASVDMLPVLVPEQHTEALNRLLDSCRVLLAHVDGHPAAAMIVEPGTGHIEYLAVHPLARGSSVVRALVDRARRHHRRLSVTTFREGDRADLGHRRTLLSLGFGPASLRTEFGHPTQLLELDPSGGPL
ncbi:helix-turn-helix domain-containing protein [Nocardiopsis alba]|uniref:helix-turn-helix domain-containing protein n=1 Tax=Nocardiopsis alba TaxID=53437 RepID=UPI0035DD0E9D